MTVLDHDWDGDSVLCTTLFSWWCPRLGGDCCFHLSSVDKQNESRIWAFHLLYLLLLPLKTKESPQSLLSYGNILWCPCWNHLVAVLLGSYLEWLLKYFFPIGGEFSHSLVYLPFILNHFTMGDSLGFILKKQMGFIYRNRNSYVWVLFKKIVQFNKSITFKCLWVLAWKIYI